MNTYRQQYPTWGDLAREQLRRKGFPYFTDVSNDLKQRLAAVSPDSRKAFALACAERIMRWHEALPPDEQRLFTLGWRPVLDAMWVGLQEQKPEALQHVQDALAVFQASPYNHDDGQDGPDDADEDAAAASIAAAECFLSGNVEAAGWAAYRAVDHAFAVADQDLQLDPNEFLWSPEAEPMPLAQEAMHPAVQGELRQQLADIAELERHGVTPELLRRWIER